MVTSVVLAGIVFGIGLYAALGVSFLTAKLLGYDLTSIVYYKWMAKKGAREAAKIMNKNRTQEPSYNEVKACLKHVLKPRYKLGNTHLRTVKRYFPNLSRNQKKYHKLVAKIEANHINRELALKYSNTSEAQKYSRRLNKLQGLKRDLEAADNSLSKLGTKEAIDWVSKIKFSELGVEFADPTTFIKCDDEKTTNEYLHYHYDGNAANGNQSRIFDPNKDYGRGLPFVAEIAFNKPNAKLADMGDRPEIKSLEVGALNINTFEKGLALLADRAIDIYDNLPDEQKDSIFPITASRVVHIDEIPNLSTLDRMKANLFSKGILPVSIKIKNIDELNAFRDRRHNEVNINEEQEGRDYESETGHKIDLHRVGDITEECESETYNPENKDEILWF